MESPYYEYYRIKTSAIEETFATKTAEDFLLANRDVESKGAGSFIGKDGQLNLQIMLVQSYDSWSDRDYNAEQANYISIVISKNSGEQDRMYIPMLLGKHLNLPLCPEDSD